MNKLSSIIGKLHRTKIVPLDIEIGKPKMIYCCICLEEKENHRFIKCGHSWCIECDKNFTNSVCPYCRYKFREPIELEIDEQQHNEEIHKCNLYCLIITLKNMLLNMIYFNNYCNNICILGRIYVYKLLCYNIFFQCHNCKCTRVRIISRPSNCINSEQISLFLIILSAFILIFVMFIFGRFFYLLLENPRDSVFFCNIDCMILTGLIGIFGFIIFGMLCLLLISCISAILHCFSKCVNIVFNLQY